MSDDAPRSARLTEDRTRVGAVPLGPDALVVEVVRRRWRTKPVATDSWRDDVGTVAPAGLEVRRKPPTAVAEPGGMSAQAARELAGLLELAADQAVGEPPTTGEPTRRASAP